MDVAGELSRDAGDGLELLAARSDQPLGRAEVREQRPLADRPHAWQLVEQGTRHRLVAPLPVELDRETVRLVAHPLEQPQGLRIVLDRERGRAARNEDL